MNALKQLGEHGQSVWLDYIRRSLLDGGELARLIEVDGLAGVTSNPAIFRKAIAGSQDYTEALLAAAQDETLDAEGVFEELAVDDIQRAADILLPVYERTAARDGYVSLEVSPHLAHDPDGTVLEAQRLWARVDRPNVMIKVPATAAGIPAIQRLIADGINVNVTLLFAVRVYDAVIEAYLAGLESRVRADLDVRRIASVASFFVSRVDSAVDKQIETLVRGEKDAGRRRQLESLAGRVAIANAKVAYQRYKAEFGAARWRALAERGAAPQRLLWASTGTKNPAYSDVLYVESLVGSDTVNTIPPATYEAFRDHGSVRPTLDDDVDGAVGVLAQLARLDIDLEAITGDLLDRGVRLFADAFDQLLDAVEMAKADASRELIGRQTYQLPGSLEAEVVGVLAEWDATQKIRRLWSRDASLWTGHDEAKWLGWLAITDDQMAHIDHFTDLRESVQAAGFTDVVVLGMGGSSLCPEVLARTLGLRTDGPRLHVLDSTDPAQVRRLDARLPIERTLFIVSSKSGSTLEPNLFLAYFYARVQETVGEEMAGAHFIAVTDPDSQLEGIARESRFRDIQFGVPSIGGRFSALSNFGMVPAAAAGFDVARLLDRADDMVQACASCVPTEQNPGAVLGALLGVLGRRGRNKVTLLATASLEPLGAWLEQLLAESTGKQGKALIPVDGERVAAPETYGQDRVFVALYLDGDDAADLDQRLDALAAAGHPVVRIRVADIYDLGQEFFRWEFATAVAGALMDINPFDQPDVEASKIATRRLTTAFEATGALPDEEPFLEGAGFALFADSVNASALRPHGELDGVLGAHLARLAPGDYFALLAYIDMNDEHVQLLQRFRHVVRDRFKVATCLGFGPRFLHSTGQAYKGGPASGVFLQVTCDDQDDLDVPGKPYTFGVVKAAQARGDFDVLAERERRALRVHLHDVTSGLELLCDALDRVSSTLT